MSRISRRPKLSFIQKDLDYLIKLSRSRNQAASIVEISKIILLSYQGINDTEISKELKVDYKTVRKWIKRVLDLGVKEGLVDKSRSGRPQDISAESRAFVISLHLYSLKESVNVKMTTVIVYSSRFFDTILRLQAKSPIFIYTLE